MRTGTGIDISSYMLKPLFVLSLFSWSAGQSLILLCAAAPTADALTNTVDKRAPAADANPAQTDTVYTKFLPAQIGGIVGSYGVSLVFVALGLLILSKKRRNHLRAADELEEEIEPYFLEPRFDFPDNGAKSDDQFQQYPFQQYPYQQFGVDHAFPFTAEDIARAGQYPPASPLSPRANFSWPASPAKSEALTNPSPITTRSRLTLGIDLTVDQGIVAQDRAMAQAQLEEMYRHVMEQEEAKEEGREANLPAFPLAQRSSSTTLKKERTKPSKLNLGREDKQSRTASFLSILKSPRKSKAPQGMNITGPIMTPVSATFPPNQHPGEGENGIPLRQYAPVAPPIIPQDQLPRRRGTNLSTSTVAMPTPDISPDSTLTIDQRLAGISLQLPPKKQRGNGRDVSPANSDRQSHTSEREPSHMRGPSEATLGSINTMPEPHSAASERSNSPLVGLPSSPKPGVNRFPSMASLPGSPRPGQQSFPRVSVAAATASASGGNPHSAGNPLSGTSAVRANGALPLRAYEPAIASPTTTSFHTKQTVFTRMGPLSPSATTPWTGAPVPYSPYQPYTPVIPVTPSLVTRADRKRMRQMMPKTPTMEMVRSDDEVW